MRIVRVDLEDQSVVAWFCPLCYRAYKIGFTTEIDQTTEVYEQIKEKYFDLYQGTI